MSEKTKPKPITGYSDKPIAQIRTVGTQPVRMCGPLQNHCMCKPFDISHVCPSSLPAAAAAARP